MGRFNKILGLSIVVASAAFIVKVFSYKKTDTSKSSIKKSTASKAARTKTKTKNVENELDTRTQKMFKDLSMTQAQKKRYQASIKTLLNKWDKDNPDNPMDAKSISKEEDKSLSAVLDEVQYGMYRDWAKKYEY